jgi:hypothetical protein
MRHKPEAQDTTGIRGRLGDVVLVDRCRRDGGVGPAHDIAGANLRTPPGPGVGGEHPGPQERPPETGSLDQPFDFRVQRRNRVGLPEERVRRPVRGGEEHDVPGVLRHPVHGGRGGAGRGGPREEHRIDAVQTPLEGRGEGEVAVHDLDPGRQAGVRVARQGADVGARRQQLLDDLAADISGGPGDEDAFHAFLPAARWQAILRSRLRA